MNLFKKVKSVWTLRGKRVPRGTPGAALTRTESAKWHVWIDRKHVPLHQNKKIAEEMAAQLLARKAAGRLGVVVASKDDNRRKALPALVYEWAAALRLKGTGEPHVELLKTRVDRVLAGCGFARLRDLNGEAAYKFIGGLRTRPGAGRPASHQTRNFYLAALKQFARFLVRKKVLHENPFDDLEPWDVKKDRRHDRRELTGDELEALISTTERDGVTRSKLTATDRAMLYRVAVFTGLRAGELAALGRDNFDLVNAEVTVPGEFTKNGEPAVQPLPPALVPVLEGWLKRKPPGQPCWPGPWAENRVAGKVLRRDLEAAGIPYVVGGLYADFHSLRHSFISRLIRGGVNLKVAQALARHSTITLTADRYGHLAHGEKRAAVAGLRVGGCIRDASAGAEGGEAAGNEGESGGGSVVLKTGDVATRPRVRIPPLPLELRRQPLQTPDFPAVLHPRPPGRHPPLPYQPLTRIAPVAPRPCNWRATGADHSGQLVDGRGRVRQSRVGVPVHRLGRLRSHPGPGQGADEGVPQAVEVGAPAAGGAVPLPAERPSMCYHVH